MSITLFIFIYVFPKCFLSIRICMLAFSLYDVRGIQITDIADQYQKQYGAMGLFLLGSDAWLPDKA